MYMGKGQLANCCSENKAKIGASTDFLYVLLIIILPNDSPLVESSLSVLEPEKMFSHH